MIDPPEGVVDARFPRGITGGEKLGIRTLKFEGPPEIDRACFELCETEIQLVGNQVVGFLEFSIDATTSSYTLSLDRPITTGAVTTITYTADDTSTTTAMLVSHPGNVNGDTISSAADVESMLAVLEGIDPGANAPWGMRSTDVDRTGVVRSSDILALIDVLNGAAVLDPWMDSPRPSTDGICP